MDIGALTGSRELQTTARYRCTCRQRVLFTDNSGIFPDPLASDSAVIRRQQRDGYSYAYWQQVSAMMRCVAAHVGKKLQSCGEHHYYRS